LLRRAQYYYYYYFYLFIFSLYLSSLVLVLFFILLFLRICTCCIGALGHQAVESVRKQRIFPSLSYFSDVTLVNQIYNSRFTNASAAFNYCWWWLLVVLEVSTLVLSLQQHISRWLDFRCYQLFRLPFLLSLMYFGILLLHVISVFWVLWRAISVQ